MRTKREDVYKDVYKANGGKSILVGEAFHKKDIGFIYAVYRMFYNPVHWDAENPYNVISVSGHSDYSVRSSSVKTAKRKLSNWDNSVKWKMRKLSDIKKYSI